MPYDKNQSIVLVVDALELRRASIASLIEAWARTNDLVTDSIAPETLATYGEKAPSVRFIILNIGGTSLQDEALQDCAHQIRDMFVAIPCAIISDRHEPEEAVAAAALGEQAFLSTNMQPEVVRQALTFILGGGTYFPREALLQSASNGKARNRVPVPLDSDPEGLTRRQYDVLEKLQLGKSNKHIARDLNMQESTVKVHVRQIMRKLGAANRTQAALLASTTVKLHITAKPESNSALLFRRTPHELAPLPVAGTLEPVSAVVAKQH